MKRIMEVFIMFKKLINLVKDIFNEKKFSERLKNDDGTEVTYSLGIELWP
jgi:predicted RNA-binding protein